MSIPNTKVELIDRSPIWGHLWNIVDKDNQGNTVHSVKTKWAQNWNLGDELLTAGPPAIALDDAGTAYNPINDGMIVRPSLAENPERQKKYFGVTQELYGIRNFGFDSEGELCDVGNLFTIDGCLNSHGEHTTQIGRYRILPYDNETVETRDHVATTYKLSNYDYLTGEPLVSIFKNASSQYDATVTSLAYHQRSLGTVYQAMKDKNMLTQDFSRTGFRFASDPSAKNFDDLPTADLDKVTGSSFNLWRDYGSGQIRKSESYILKNKAGFGYPEPHSSLLGNKWLQQGINQSYDGYGNLLESTSPAGVNDAEIFAYGHSLPSAYAANAKSNQIFHQSFETTEYLSGLTGVTANQTVSGKRSWTGGRSLKIVNCQEELDLNRVPKAECGANDNSSFVCFNAPKLDLNQSYVASAWYFDEFAGSNLDNPSDAAFRNKKTKVTRPGLFIGVDGGAAGCFEEVHPNGGDANLSASSWMTPAANDDWDAPARASGSKKWKRIWTEFRPGSHCSATQTLDNAIFCLYASKHVPGSDVYFDEVRLRPKNSLMETFTYDQMGNATSVSDANEVVTHYQYDKFGNLSGVRNQEGVILSEQAKRRAAIPAQWSIKQLPNFNGACQEFELISNPENMDNRFEFVGTAPENSATVDFLTGHNGVPSPFLCNQSLSPYDITLFMKGTGRNQTFHIGGRTIPTVVINGCHYGNSVSDFTAITKMAHYDGLCYDLDHRQSWNVPLNTHFGIHLPEKADLEALGMAHDDVLLGYKIRFDFPRVNAQNPHPENDKYPLHLKFNWFDDLGSVDNPEFDGVNFRKANHGDVLPGREFKMVTGGYASLSNVCETYIRQPAEKPYTLENLGIVGNLLNGSVTETGLQKDPYLFAFSLYGNLAPVSPNGFWPYTLGNDSGENSGGKFNVKITITPITGLSPDQSQGAAQCAQ
jgi:YD repeat-containing protein